MDELYEMIEPTVEEPEAEAEEGEEEEEEAAILAGLGSEVPVVVAETAASIQVPPLKRPAPKSASEKERRARERAARRAKMAEKVAAEAAKVKLTGNEYQTVPAVPSSHYVFPAPAAPAKTLAQLMAQPNITFRELYDSWPASPLKTVWANRIMDLINAPQAEVAGLLGLSMVRKGPAHPGLVPKGSQVVPYSQRPGSLIAFEGPQAPTSLQDQLGTYFRTILGEKTALAEKWLTMPAPSAAAAAAGSSGDARIPKSKLMLLQEVMSVTAPKSASVQQVLAKSQPQSAVERVEGRVLRSVPGSLQALKQQANSLATIKGNMVTIRDSLTDAAKRAAAQVEIDEIDAQLAAIDRAVRSERIAKESERKAVLQTLAQQSMEYVQRNREHVLPVAKALGARCENEYEENIKRGICPPRMNMDLYNMFVWAMNLIDTEYSLDALRQVLAEFRVSPLIPEMLRACVATVSDMLAPVPNPVMSPAAAAAFAPAAAAAAAAPEEGPTAMEISPVQATGRTAAAHAAHVVPAIATAQVGQTPAIFQAAEEAIEEEEDLSDVDVEDVLTEFVRVREQPEIHDIGACEDPTGLSPSMLHDAASRIWRKKYVLPPFNASDMVAALQSAIADIGGGGGGGRRPPTAEEAARIVSIVSDPIMEMLRQHLYYEVTYDNGGTSFPVGLAALYLVANRRISLEDYTFPVMSYYPGRLLLKLKDRLAKQQAMHRNYATDQVFAEGCVKRCSTGTAEDSMLFYPRFVYGIASYQGYSAIVAKPSDDKPSTFPLCSWSPAPALMSTRANPPPNLKDFVVPGLIMRHGRVYEGNLMQDRVFLTTADKTSGCGYRMGRFVCQGSGTEDAYYAWMAEAGVFQKSFFFPLQNVTIFFTHYSQSDYDQFSRRFALNAPGMLQFCGHIRVRCCVPGAGNEYENQEWLGSVMMHVDGSLRTFLDGPDTELLDGDQMWSTTSDQKDVLLRYFTEPTFRDNTRFQNGFNTMEDLWSRTITMLQVFEGVMRSCDPMVYGSAAVHEHEHAHAAVQAQASDAMVNYNLCPEEFVYTTDGISLSGGPRSYFINHSTRGRPRFGRVNKAQIELNRVVGRGDMYKFSALGIGASCLPLRSVPERGAAASAAYARADVCDYYTRCAGEDGRFARYPRLHSADPFVPVWALDAHDWIMRQDPRHHLAIRRHIIAEQQMLLLRYVALKMKLGLRFKTADINEIMARMQYRESPPVLRNKPGEKLYQYCQEKWDMAIFAAQYLQDERDAPANLGSMAVGSATGASGSKPKEASWCHCMDAIFVTLGPGLAFNSTAGKSLGSVLLAIQDSLTRMSPIHALIEKNAQLDDAAAKAIVDFDVERRRDLYGNIRIAIDTVEQRIKQTDSDAYRVDKTPLK